ncbi:autotransporter domain-containing protein [Taklimakanibacter lacteus]|uniref:autotransporter domain-containing protein n=1 Tax=Taklimakanibacter lacteus TaxID=2268456 RepID=UPI000E6645BE
MARPRNSIASGTQAPETTSRIRRLRARLAVTTIFAVVPFLGYGRQAYAACVPSPSPTFVCSDTSTGEGIFADNADVSTLANPPFVVTEDGVFITGRGDQRFIDTNAATSITNSSYYGRGLSVVSTDDYDGTIGAVTIFTDGTISGTAHGIYADNRGSGDITITANGTVTGVDIEEEGDNYVANDGIYARNYGNNLTITTGVGSSVTGEHNGIDARNYGTGDLTITTNGEVKSDEFDGIFARNGSPYYQGGAQNLTVTIGAQSVVDGAGNGLQAQNYGSGILEITVDGSVTGQGYDGIHAINGEDGTDLIITTDVGSLVKGNAPLPDLEEDPEAPIDSNGIDARNYGTGQLRITANGEVFGNLNDGIYAVNEGTDLTIETGDQSLIRGGGNGIGAYNNGSGNLTVNVQGTVGGYAEPSDFNHGGDGIRARNSEDGGNLIIATDADSDVFGGKDGIHGDNYGTGFLSITADGKVTGKGEYYESVGAGIRAYQSSSGTGNEDGDSLKITTGANSEVTGTEHGIYAENAGEGNLTITANGIVTGEDGNGIEAINRFGEFFSFRTFQNEFGDGNDLTITTGATSVVTGGYSGIVAINRGDGDIAITANGRVTGKYGDGIYALDGPEGNDFTITVGVAGLVQGYRSGIRAYSDDDQPISITNDGLVRNLSLDSIDLAIKTEGGATHIDNNGVLIGQVLLDSSDAYDDLFDNDGVWDAAGIAGRFSDFGEGVDTFNNNNTLVAADDATTLEETRLNRLEFFNNNGLITLVDGQAGDRLLIGPGVVDNNVEVPTDYTSVGGRLWVDALLGPGASGIADKLELDNATTSDLTEVSVNVVGVTGANFDGITVVTGVDSDGHFALENGPFSAGFFQWDMRFDPDSSTYELFTLGDENDPTLGGGAFEFPSGISGAQDFWFQTTSALFQRQADLRALLGGTGVTPVADFSEPVDPTPVAKVTPGFWVSGVGAYIERDDEEGGFVLDRKQTIWGALAGFDFGTQSVGDALMFGVFGGYLTSELKFKDTGSKWEYEGPSVGAYATYMDRAFFADLTVKVDFLDIDVDPQDAVSDSDTDAVNIGGRFDTGYKFGESVFIEPQASLAVLHTEIDDLDIFGGTVEFDDETSVRGRLGVRLGFDHAASNSVVYSGDVIASIWEDFSGDNDVTIAVPGLPDSGVSDNPGDTTGDVSVGLSAMAPEGWSTFLRGNYQFADDYEAVSGNVGVRIAW